MSLFDDLYRPISVIELQDNNFEELGPLQEIMPLRDDGSLPPPPKAKDTRTNREKFEDRMEAREREKEARRQAKMAREARARDRIEEDREKGAKGNRSLEESAQKRQSDEAYLRSGNDRSQAAADSRIEAAKRVQSTLEPAQTPYNTQIARAVGALVAPLPFSPAGSQALQELGALQNIPEGYTFNFSQPSVSERPELPSDNLDDFDEVSGLVWDSELS